MTAADESTRGVIDQRMREHLFADSAQIWTNH
jgi:hypothetical protein